MDMATGDIRAMEFTPSQTGNSPVLPDLLAQIPSEQPIGTVPADGAYNTRKCHSVIADRGGTSIIPIRRNGRAWKRTAPLPAHGTRPCGQPSASAGPSGND